MKPTKRNGVTIQPEQLPDARQLAGMVQNAERAVREAREDIRRRDRTARYLWRVTLRWA